MGLNCFRASSLRWISRFFLRSRTIGTIFDRQGLWEEVISLTSLQNAFYLISINEIWSILAARKFPKLS